MAEPALVRDCVAAMRDAVDLPVTVKHRIGVDRGESYDFVRDFVGTVAEAGCTVFIVHARNAWLKGLSPKENREVPPLRYDFVYRLKRDFPALTIVLNGGVTSNAQIAEHLQHVDGVMLGRTAYHQPWLMAEWDARFLGGTEGAALARETVEAAMAEYMTSLVARGVTWPHAARHMMGLHHGLPGARRWRQVWSDHKLKDVAPALVMQQAHQAMALRAAEAEVLG
jgi:tRNA-dihydrouridine synthase A